MRGDDRAVSDLVGFVLTFSLIIASVGIVATVGFDQIAETRDQEQTRNAEQSMVELAESFDYVLQRTDGERRAGLAVSGGTLEFQRSHLEVTIDPSSSSSTSYNTTTNAIVHELGDYQVGYEGGAVFAGGGQLLRYKPAVSCRGDTAIVSLLSYNISDVGVTGTTQGSDRVGLVDTGGTAVTNNGVALTDPSVISNEGSVVIQATYKTATNITRERFSSADVSIDISGSTFTDGWTRFGKDFQRGWTVSGTTLECNGVRNVLVRETVVTLTLVGA